MIDLCYQTQALADIDRAKYAGSDRQERRAHSVVAAPRWPVVDEVRSRSAGGRIPDRTRAVGSRRGRHPARQPAGQEGDRLPDGPPAAVWRMDGSAAVVREFQDAVSRDAVRHPRAQHLFPAGGAQGLEFAGQSIHSRAIRSLCSMRSTTFGTSLPRSVVAQIEAATQSNEVLIRQAAAEALGRLALPSSLPALDAAARRSQQAGPAHRRVGAARDLQPARRCSRSPAALRSELQRRSHPLGGHARLRASLLRTGRNTRNSSPRWNPASPIR